MREMGPLPQISTIESKHQEGKKTANVSRSRVNIAQTLAVKHQFILNYRFIKEKEQKVGSNNYVCGPVSDFDCSGNDFDCILDKNGNSKTISSTKWITLMGMEIETDTILMKESIHGPKFFNVKNIFSNKELGFFLFLLKN